MSADQATLLAGDAAARSVAQSEFDEPLVVEAGAGTGKTALLVARVLRWCLGPGWERHWEDADGRTAVATTVLDRVVAITFTEAAAAEMAARVEAAFAAVARQEEIVGVDLEPLGLEAGELGERAAALADAIDRLRVQTIHSFCTALLRAHPIEAGVHPLFTVDADGLGVEGVVGEVVRASLRDAAAEGSLADWQTLAREGVEPPQVAELLERLVDERIDGQALRRDPFDAGAVGAAWARLAERVGAMLAVGDGRLAGVTRSAAGKVHRRLAALAEALDEEAAGIPRLVELAGGCLAEVKSKLNHWAKGQLADSEADALGDTTAAAVADPAAKLLANLKALAELRLDALAAARRLLARLLDRARAKLREAGIVTFDELVHGAERLLAASSRVRLLERGRIDQLLVDEFQDTDAAQCAVVKLLALDGPRESRPGLFVVGDPKQSIYGFRNADLAAYDRFKERVRDEGGAVVNLCRCFRSAPAVLAEVERVIEPAMRGERGVQAEFVPLVTSPEIAAARRLDDDDWAPVEHWVGWLPSPDEDSLGPPVIVAPSYDLEALAVADDIARLHAAGRVAGWGDVAVLVRTGTGLAPLLDALRAHGVPFEVARDRDYYRQREVVEAAALIRYVLEPGDRLALLTVLRSDVVGLPDSALLAVWQGGLPAALGRLESPEPEAVEPALGLVAEAATAWAEAVGGARELPGWPHALAAAVVAIGALRRAWEVGSPARFVEILRTLWLAEASAARRYLGRHRRERLERFYATLEESLAADDASSAAVGRFLRRAVAEAREPARGSEPDLEADAVHVFTVHGAKGLGFDHVYLLQCGRGVGRAGGSKDGLQLVEGGRVECSFFGWQTLGWDEVVRRDERREKAEMVRLLYVAMTRAKRRLVLSSTWKKRREDGGRVTSAATFEDLIAVRFDPGVLARQAEAGEAAADHDGARWVLPAVKEGGPPASTRPSVLETVSVDPRCVRRELEALGRLRAEAAARMARPFSIAASTEAHRRLERDDEEASQSAIAGTREVATEAGTVIHRLLERLDLGRPLIAQVSELAGGLVAELREGPARADAAAIAERVGELVDRLVGGACLGKLAAIADRVVARELPLLAPPRGDEGAVGFVAGSIDLVYREPESGRLVVADFKTDQVDDEQVLARRLEAYRLQVGLYADVLGEALGLDARPAAELWFLDADRVVRL